MASKRKKSKTKSTSKKEILQVETVETVEQDKPKALVTHRDRSAPIISTETLNNIISAETLGGDVVSFGGKSMSDNVERVNNAIVKMEKNERIWNKSNSQFAVTHLVLNQKTHIRILRQITAEVSRKRDALEEAKWKHLKTKAEIAIMQEELDLLIIDNGSRAQIAMKEIEIGEKESQLNRSMKYIEGALKEVIVYETQYDALIETHGEPTEQQFEEDEYRANIKRAIAQSLRDMRQTGKITKGEQEYLEDMGINVSQIMKLMKSYLIKESSVIHGKTGRDDFTTCLLEQFLEDCALNFKYNPEIALRLKGLPEKPNYDACYDWTKALPPSDN